MLHDLVVMPDGTTYASGYGASAMSMTGLTAKLTSAGRKAWLKKYTGPEGIGAAFIAITPRPGGGVYSAGTAMTAGPTLLDQVLLAYTF